MIEIPEKRADAHKWLLQFKEIKENWLDEVVAERTGSKRTVEAYLDRIIPFIQYMKMTPAEIVAKGAEETRKEQAGVLRRYLLRRQRWKFAKKRKKRSVASDSLKLQLTEALALMDIANVSLRKANCLCC